MADLKTRSAVRDFISADLHVQRPCCPYANRPNKEQRMQIDLREFLARLAGAVAMTLIPVVFIAFLSMPSSLHHHLGNQPNDLNAPAVHMT